MTKTAKRLAKPFYDQVVRLLDSGNELLDKDKNERALDTFQRALEPIPKPHDNYEISSLVYASIGDAYFFQHQFEEALTNFEEAQRIHGELHGHFEPFLLLRAGQSQFNIGDRDDNEEALAKAGKLLSDAYKSMGDEIFEDEDPVYLEFAKAHSGEAAKS
jgi:tetratricopeptide (TPR) repeat protein